MTFRYLAASVLLLTACGGATDGAAGAAEPEGASGESARPVPARSERPPTAEELALSAHVLNRFAFGPRPGRVEEVARLGPRHWLASQLRPGRIDESRRMEALEPHALAVRDPQEIRRWFRRRVHRDGVYHGSVRRELRGHFQMSVIARHVASERQLHEVMVDFWTNHFNVCLRKGAVRWLAGDYLERAIRPHALGRFEDLLVATARHPAMLVYLDNHRSVAEGAGGPAPNAGLNENYARELLELHTVGVDGGYTQRDVVEVARILTGWTSSNHRSGEPVRFVFREAWHDDGEKTVMGREFPAGGGEREGLELLSFLAHHPSTARFLARKLLTRFVADEPPEECVEPVAERYLASDTDIAETLRAVIRCPVLWEPENRGAKVKTPLELVVSTIRAVDGDLTGEPGPARASAALLQPVLMEPVPTGYPDVAAEWTGAGAMLARMDFVGRLAAGEVDGVRIDLDRLAAPSDDAERVADDVLARVLAGRSRVETRTAIVSAIEDEPDPRRARRIAVGFALASPEFQRQ